MGLDRAALVAGLGRIAARMEQAAEELNGLDGQLGDGDLGVTMVRGSREVVAILPTLPDDLGVALMKCAQAFTKISGSSFGTLLATGLMSAAKAAKGRTEIEWSELSVLLGGALDAMVARGKAELGQKTVLDVLEAARAASAGLDDPDAIQEAAEKAVQNTLDAFRDEPAQIGRARIFGDKSIGLDDPGMVAFRHMVEALRAE